MAKYYVKTGTITATLSAESNMAAVEKFLRKVKDGAELSLLVSSQELPDGEAKYSDTVRVLRKLGLLVE